MVNTAPLSSGLNYENQHFTGERALMQLAQASLTNCIFDDGESPLKHSQDIHLHRVSFGWKYPLWYSQNINISHSHFLDTARAGIWYTRNLVMSDTLVAAPKTFRRCQNLHLINVDLPNAEETLWACQDLTLHNVSVRGAYFAMNCERLQADNLRLAGDYAFDGAKDLSITNSVLISKDLLWNSENVTVANSVLNGQYLGWNSRNMRLTNCLVTSEQGICYIDDLIVENCNLLETTAAFEYSQVDVSTNETIKSVLNPLGGIIRAAAIEALTLDPKCVNPDKTQIIINK